VEEVWPFTSKVWAALAVATIRTASRTDLLNAKCTMNAEATILLPPWLIIRLAA
jgi:hypothetical protein